MNAMGGACSTYGEEEKCIQGFGGKPKGKKPLGRPRHRWEDNIKMDLQKVEWVRGAVDWVDLAQDRDMWRAFLNYAMSFRIP